MKNVQSSPKGATATKETAKKIAFEKAGNNTRRATGNGARPFWYLDHTRDLSAVTSEAKNEALGIREIHIFEPTKKQAEIGVLCKVRIFTHAATIDNISIFESDHTEGDIYLQMGGGRQIGTEDSPKWARDCKLTSLAKAQILSYVHSLLIPVK